MPILPQDKQEAAEKIRTNLDRKVEAARGDVRLSPLGRQQRVAAAYSDAARQMGAISDAFNSGVVQTSSNLQRQLFGSNGPVSGSDAISIRDAQDRAAQLQSGDEALALLARAERSGDDHLARAVAARAFEGATSSIGGADWGRVVDAYTTSRPEVGNKMQELAAAQSHNLNDAVFNAGLTWLGKPDELSKMGDSQIEDLSAENPETIPERPPNQVAHVGGAYM